MTKKIAFILLLLAATLAGCSSGPDYDVQLTQPLYFANKPMPFEIKVTEDDKPVKGLDITAELSMTTMNHGTFKADFEEGEKGIYTSSVKLPMGGKYEIALVMKKGDKEIEKILDYEVKKPEGVATVNGQWITSEDMEFYSFINKLHTAINREKDQKKLSGKELEEANAYWDAQDKANENQNQLLTQIIRLRSMAMLAEEKGHKASDAEIKKEIENVRKQYEELETAKKMIVQYGEEKFWAKQETQYEMIVLSQKVQQDLIAKVKKENPKVGEQEINFIAKKEYEELLVSQVNSLKIELF